jgi:hypothetical protein
MASSDYRIHETRSNSPLISQRTAAHNKPLLPHSHFVLSPV